jgi:glycosyltransferase involved in cell wall biosynthesis
MPLYNEGPVVADVVRDLRRTFPLVICVDDGSTDDSRAAAEQAGGLLIRHEINMGAGAATQTGLDFALEHTDAAYFITFDADGQHQSADARIMAEMLDRDEADAVFGSRFLDDRTNFPFVKRIVLSLAVRYTNRTTGVRLTDAHNGLRAFNRRAASEIHLTQYGMAHASEIVEQVAQRDLRIAEAPVHVVYTEYSRAKGQSLWNSVNILFDLVVR